MKVGGNVASYFCLSDGTVIHAVAGPLNPQQYLREAKWAVDVRKLAVAEAGGDVAKYRATLRRAHLERLAAEYGMTPTNLPGIAGLPPDGPARFAPRARPEAGKTQAVSAPPVPSPDPLQGLQARRRSRCGNDRGLANQGQVHCLLAHYPLPKLAQLYPVVFEGILKEKISTLPVQAR